MTLESTEEVKELVKSVLRFSNGIHNSYWNKDRLCKYAYVNCPCGKDSLQGLEVNCDKEGDISKDSVEYAISCLSYKLLDHIERKIRLRADKFHIDLLIKLFGVEKSMMILERWARQNMLVALALKKYVEELKLKHL